MKDKWQRQKEQERERQRDEYNEGIIKERRLGELLAKVTDITIKKGWKGLTQRGKNE